MGADDNTLSYFSYHLQPPLVLPRRGDAGYSVIVFPLRLLRYCLSSDVTPLLYFLCRSLRYCLSSAVVNSHCHLSLPCGGGQVGADDNIRSYFSNHLRPPLVLPRRGDEGYSVTVFSIQVTPLLYFLCRLLRYCIFYAGYSAIVFPQQSSPVIAICPSPTGEVRWGL